MRRWSIGLRLTSVFVSILLLMLCGTAIALRQLSVMRTQAHRLDVIDRQVEAMLRLHSDVLSLRETLERSVNVGDADRFAHDTDALRTIVVQHIDEADRALAASRQDSERHQTIRDSLAAARVSLLAQADSMTAMARARDWPAVRLRLDNQLKSVSEVISELMQDLDAEVAEDRQRTLGSIHTVQQQAQTTLVVSGLLILLAACVLGVLVTRSIVGPLADLHTGAQALARGDFQFRVGVQGQDELADLGRVFNETSSTLKSLYQVLHSSETHFRSLIENASDLIVLLDAEGTIVYSSPSLERVLDCQPSALAGGDVFASIHPLDVLQAQAAFDACLQRPGATAPLICRVRDRDGSWRSLEAVANNLLADPAVAAVVVNCRDITERKRAEEYVATSLKEKEVLLKEVHHRVKNNLQIVSSLLNLQAQNVRDEETRQLFRESQSRIHSIAMIHERLCQSGDLSRIQVGEYVQSLTTHLVHSFGVDPSRVQVRTSIAESVLGIDIAVPCALLINELVANALRHAFPGDRRGEVKVELQNGRVDELVLTVGDNGVGMPPDVDVKAGRSLGLELVSTLTEQLEGRLELERNGGTQFRITFPAPSKR
jgi:PAS domain S-box-containing protein